MRARQASVVSHRPVSWVVWLVLGVLVFALALLFPPTGDDWRRIDFADRTPSGYLAEVLRYYQGRNGRVMGNTLSYLLIEPAWLRALVKAVTVVGLVAALHRVVGSRTVWGVLLCFVGVFLVPGQVFRETFSWSAGFFHYVPPMIGVVLLVGTLSGRWPGGSRANSWLGASACAVIGAMTCLFIEHVTVAAAVLALAGLGLAMTARRGPSRALLGWVVGAVAATVVMISSPGLQSSATGEHPYYGAAGVRSLTDTAVANYAVVTASFVFSAPVIMGLIVVTCLHQGLTRLRRPSNVADLFVVLGTVLVGAYAVVSRTALADRVVCAEATVQACDPRMSGIDPRMLAIDLLMLALLLAVLVVTGLRVLTSMADRAVWVGMLAAALLMLGPLLVVEPIGPRNVYGPLVTVVGMVAVTARPWVDGRGARALVLRTGLAATAVAGLTWLGIVQWSNAQVAAARATAMEDAVAERRTEVVLPRFPYPEWVHDPEDTKMGHHHYLEGREDIRIRFE